MTSNHSLQAKVWLYQGDSPWHFITIPKTQSDEITKDYIWPRRGFGAIPVYVTIGSTKWKTSVFPDSDGSYVLPIKKDVRIKEGIRKNDSVTITLTVIS